MGHNALLGRIEELLRSDYLHTRPGCITDRFTHPSMSRLQYHSGLRSVSTPCPVLHGQEGQSEISEQEHKGDAANGERYSCRRRHDLTSKRNRGKRGRQTTTE